MSDPRTVSVIIPACNEAEAIGDVVAEPWRGGWHQILVIDDGSTDGTRESRRGRRRGRRTRTQRQRRRGEIGSAATGVIRSSTAGSRPLGCAAAGGNSASDLVVGAGPPTRRPGRHGAGNALLNRLASYLTEREIPT